jgi:hypothetical protein
MKKRELRGEGRISISEKGSLKTEDAWFPCTILNMSNNGLLMMSSRTFPVGQVLEFRCELYPGKTLNCKIEIRHISEAGIGAKIVEIDRHGIRLCELYLEEQYSHRLGKY